MPRGPEINANEVKIIFDLTPNSHYTHARDIQKAINERYKMDMPLTRIARGLEFLTRASLIISKKAVGYKRVAPLGTDVMTAYGKYVSARKLKQQESRKAMKVARELGLEPAPVAEQPRVPTTPVYEVPRLVEVPKTPQISYRDDDLVEITIVGKAVKQRYLLTTVELKALSQSGHTVSFTHNAGKKSWFKRLFRS